MAKNASHDEMDDLTQRILDEMDGEPEPEPKGKATAKKSRSERAGEERTENRGTSLRLLEPDWETIDIDVGLAAVQRLQDVYRKGAETLDRRRADQSLGRCSVCGNPWPEGRWRSEKACPHPSDPMRFQVFRMCTDRCALILDQHITAFRTNDQAVLARIRKDFFPSQVKRLPNKAKSG